MWGISGEKAGRVSLQSCTGAAHDTYQDAIYRGFVLPHLVADGPMRMIRFPDNVSSPLP